MCLWRRRSCCWRWEGFCSGGTEEMLARGFAAGEEQRGQAGWALEHLARTGVPGDGGFGWNNTVKAAAARAYLNLALGRYEEAERWYGRTVDLDLAHNPRPAP